MTRLKAGITASAIAIGMLAAANGVAYAATGHAFVLGVSNSASTTTVLTRTTAGAPLALYAKPGSAPLAVNSATRVAKLNADMVDGLHASSLQLHAIRYALPTTTAGLVRVTLPNLAHGVYLASFTAEIYSATVGDHTSCAFADTSHGYPQVTTDVQFIGHYGFATASGVLDARTASFVFTCGSGAGPFHFVADGDSSLFLTPIASMATVNAVPAP